MTDYKAIRTELGFTQKELGELLGIDPTQISKAENGHEVPAMYEYALKGLAAEAGGGPDQSNVNPVDLEALEQAHIERVDAIVEENEKLKARIAELQKNTVTPATTEQPKPKRRGLGRPKGAQVHGMDQGE